MHHRRVHPHTCADLRELLGLVAVFAILCTLYRWRQGATGVELVWAPIAVGLELLFG